MRPRWYCNNHLSSTVHESIKVRLSCKNFLSFYLFIKAQFTNSLYEALSNNARSRSSPHPFVPYNLLSEPLIWHLTNVASITIYPFM